MSHDFSTNQHFLDPQTTNDGKPYGPWRYKKIVEECFYISHQIHTSYTDLMKISPRERVYLIEFLNKEAEQLQKAREESNKNIQKKIEEIKSSKRTIAKR